MNNKRDWLGQPEDRLLGFSWRGGLKINTVGVLMWPDIFLCEIERRGKGPDKLAIVLFDTQGLFDMKSSTADNARIFALSTLLSSMQIFNLNGLIQENQLEYLQMAIDYVLYNTKVNTNNYEKPFQNILFLIRDWVHLSDHPYGFNGGYDYIQDVLSLKNNRNPALKNVRQYIKDSFKNIDCFLMPYPGNKITMPGHNGSLVLMEENFKDNLAVLIEKLFRPSNLVQKRILGETVNGQQFGEYMKTSFEIFQSPVVPEIQSIFKITVEKQREKFLAYCMELYKQGIINNTDENQDREELDKSLENANEIAVTTVIFYYKSLRKIGTREYVEKFEQRLKKEMENFFKEWKLSTMEVHDKMKKQQKESQVELDKLIKENEERIKAMIETFEVELRKLNETFVTKIKEVQKNFALTQKQRDDQITQIQNETAQNQKKANETNQKLFHENQAELDRVKLEYKEKPGTKNEILKEYQDNLMENIKESIEDKRRMSINILREGIKIRLEMIKLMEEPWKNEKIYRDKQMRLLNHAEPANQEIRQKIMEIERGDRIREQEQEKARDILDSEILERRLEIIKMSKSTEENHVLFDQHMSMLKSLL